MITIYNLQDASGFGNLGGAAYGGGASMGFSMPVAPASSNVGGFPMMMPMMGGNCGGVGDGGGLLGLLAILAIAGRGGLGGGHDGGHNGGGDCAVSNCHNALTQMASDFNAAQHASTIAAIQGGAAASVSATNQAAAIAAQHNSDMANCNGFLQTQKGFADLGMYLCGQFNNIGDQLAASTAIINGNINQLNTGMLLGQARTDLELCKGFGEVRLQNAVNVQAIIANSDRCCCETNRNIDSTRCEVLNAIHADGNETRALITQNTIQDLRDRLQAEQFANSQCKQNAFIENQFDRQSMLINPPITRSIPVSGSQPLFPTVISAEAFCGFGDTSFRNNRGGCGNFGNGNGCCN